MAAGAGTRRAAAERRFGRATSLLCCQTRAAVSAVYRGRRALSVQDRTPRDGLWESEQQQPSVHPPQGAYDETGPGGVFRQTQTRLAQETDPSAHTTCCSAALQPVPCPDAPNEHLRRACLFACVCGCLKTLQTNDSLVPSIGLLLLLLLHHGAWYCSLRHREMAVREGIPSVRTLSDYLPAVLARCGFRPSGAGTGTD